MLLFLMIPVSLLAFTIAIGPVLVMTLLEHRAHERVAVAPARAGDDRHDARDGTERPERERTLTGVG